VVDVAVVTDSTSYLPSALVDSLGITVVSLYYDVGDGAVRESDFDGDFGRFYAALDASKSVATTSPPTAEDFVVAFERLLQQRSRGGADLLRRFRDLFDGSPSSQTAGV
jgi:fatty acid-binding protein DegV